MSCEHPPLIRAHCDPDLEQTIRAFRLSDLVQEFLYGPADAFESSRLGYRQIRTGDVPSLGGDLVPSDKVFRRRAVNSRPSLQIAEDQIHGVRNFRHEVVDISVPIAIVSGGEEQLCVVVQEDEAHIVQCADYIPAAEVAFQRLQQSAKSLCSARCKRNDSGELRDFALTGADTTGVLSSSPNCQLSSEIGQTSLQRRSSQFGRIGIKLT